MLPKNPVYFPIERGVYEVTAGLKPLASDLGHGVLDQKNFQLTEDFPLYRKNKVEALNERVSKYICRFNLESSIETSIALWICQRLCLEWPDVFSMSETGSSRTLNCNHSGDSIIFDSLGTLTRFETKDQFLSPVSSLLDALALQVQEDLAITSRSLEPKKDWISYLHLCAPSHWAAEDKIGKSFFEVHKPVAGIDRILKVSEIMVDAMITKGPFQRFVWSFVTDLRLNHHPIPAPGWDPGEWKGRSFKKGEQEPFYFRVERQTTTGFPELQASLFTIRVYFSLASEIKADPRKKEQLSSALKSMSPESKIYKGVATCFEDLIQFLDQP
jgi:hypothetical protein